MTGPHVGLVEWFHLGDEERVEECLASLAELGVKRLRTGVSWADWHTPGGQQFYGWLLPRLSSQVEVLPCFTYTPPSLAVRPKSSAPPRNPKDYADFIDQMITLFGDHFEWAELWNEPNSLMDWDWRLDHNWEIFTRMITMAGYWARHRGKKTVLGGMCPLDINWLRMMKERGVLDLMDAVGIHGFPGTWEYHGETWPEKVELTREVLAEASSPPQLWITEAGYSTWRKDERVQVEKFEELVSLPVERLYWYCLQDLHPDRSHQEGLQADVRHYHLGLKTYQGRPKLLYRMWKKPDAARRYRRACGGPRVVITGGAGFLGSNLAARLAAEGNRVVLYDNLSRPGVMHNLEWLEDRKLGVELGDVGDRLGLRTLLKECRGVFHLAAQTAVTTSIEDPAHDFAVNLEGTFSLLEELRRLHNPPPLLFASTNKVYGDLAWLTLVEEQDRYRPADQEALGEDIPLEFHSPYGCSKGAADQYVIDYARTYCMPAAVFRMSCVYGPRQFGNEDQGWLAHFMIRTLAELPITLFGDGKQVRDLLFVDDAVEAYVRAWRQIDRCAGQAFNLGGGPENSRSLREVLSDIERLHGRPPRVKRAPGRRGDQRYFVADTRLFERTTGWKARTSVEAGMERLYGWLVNHHPELRREAALV